MALCVDGSNALRLGFLEWQNTVFDNPAKRKVVPKGRRCGFTHGCGKHLIRKMLGGTEKVLWGDTICTNINKYYERYILPDLSKLDKSLWHWSKQEKELHILDNVCDFRSADRPENWEGFGYDFMILNEAGIIFQDRYLWENAILPMSMDTDPEIIIGGAPKGRKSKKDGKPHVFFELAERAQAKQLTEPERWLFYRATYRDNPTLSEKGVQELLDEVPAAVRSQEIEGLFTTSDLDSIFKVEWWKEYEVIPPDSETIRTIQSWDTAYGDGEEHDLSVCTTWRETRNGYYLVDLWDDQVLFPDLLKEAIRLAKKWKPNKVLVEKKSSGQALVPSMQKITEINVEGIPTGKKDKATRAAAASPLVEKGLVHLPKRASWLQGLKNDLDYCPDCECWDRVDSVSQALNWFIKHSGRTGLNVSRFEL